jgi:hypothetical protein
VNWQTLKHRRGGAFQAVSAFLDPIRTPRRQRRGAADGIPARARLLLTSRSSDDDELTHHPGILMLENVTVIHVWMMGIGKIREFRDDPHG